MKKLNKILSFSYLNNDYYREALGNKLCVEIEDFPILSREVLQKNKISMLSTQYKAKHFRNSLQRVNSSGTSGIPVNVYWYKKDYYKSMIYIWRLRKKFYNIDLNSKQVNFVFSNYKKDENKLLYKMSKNCKTLSFNKSCIINSENFYKMINLIKTFDPDWLYIQPFILEKITDYYLLNKQEIPSNLKYIESVGEILTQSTRSKVENLFNIPLVNMYGSEEMNVIAYECPNKIMHVLTENVYVEILKQNKVIKSGIGEAIITNLNNYAMPLIRYNQGDIIDLKYLDHPCTCGLSSQVITSIAGRTREGCTIGNNELNTYAVIEIIDILNNELGNSIRMFNFIYIKSSKSLNCNLYIAENFLGWEKSISLLLTDIITKKYTFAEINYNIKLFSFEVLGFKKHQILSILD